MKIQSKEKKFSGDYERLFNCKTKVEIEGLFKNYSFLATYYYCEAIKTGFISCKETFNTLIWSPHYQTKTILPAFAFNVGKEKMGKFIWLMNLIHKQWGLNKFSYIISDCGNLIFVRNAFWRQNVAHTELLSIFAKVSKNWGHVFNAEAQDLKSALDKLIKLGVVNYFSPQILFVLDFGKNFVEHIYGINVNESDSLYQRLFSLGCNGLVTSLRNIANKQPEKFKIAQ